MDSVYPSNRRIVKNSLIVYLRLFVTTVIGLVTSRIVLQALGASDYGLYNVVGGVIALFAVIAGSMSSTTIRFLNIEIGKQDGDPNKIFNICQVAHIGFAMLVLFLGETLGLFYIWNYLNVVPGKEGDAMFVFQVSTIVACIGIINVPFQSVFVAKEKFLHIAIIEIFNALVRLGAVVLLLFYKGNALRLYAIIMSLSTLISFVAYHYLCGKYWPDLVKWKLQKEYRDYKEVLTYNNYNLLASVALIGRSQGSNMLINFFFGTIVNAAFGIARMVQSFVELFTVNLDSAAAPQITQSVGAGNLERASSLASRICRLCQLLSLLVVFPLFVEMESVLKVWLGEVPEHTVLFCRIMLITVLVASTGGGFLRLKDALGKIKWFMLTYSFWFLLTLPVGYVFFKHGYPPETILVLFVITDLICRVNQLFLMKRIYNYDVSQFCKEAYIRPFLVVFLMVGYVLVYLQWPITGGVSHLFGFIITFIIGVFLIASIGLTRAEKTSILQVIRQRILNNSSR